ncbi:MAG: glycosyltransferase family 2 protein [Bacteroidetes bacterium]|nr:glycosyltransferase family 2 protein [Bacteroidota bacterium]MCL5737082.1 glycosyltransferase family 2 protein [Bacteroidota bacterium]
MSPRVEDALLVFYIVVLSFPFIFGTNGFLMIYYYFKYRDRQVAQKGELKELPVVTIQLPVYNELYVVNRVVDSICSLDYPKDKIEIQVLDDSTDETSAIIAQKVIEKSGQGFDIKHIRRGSRQGYKAGALKYGLAQAKGEYVAIFDADFIPRVDFLKRTLPYFTDEKIGLVQTRWEHINSDYSLLTRAQAIALDGHFVIEQQVRNKAGFFINFNGTAGIWRRSCIEDAGNWEADTLAEDLDLSYRAQLKGWQFVFMKEYTSPAELPADINGLRSQQFRWTKGAIEASKKLLPRVWKSKLPLRVKIHSTVHLSASMVYPFVLLIGILQVPIVFIKHSGHYDATFIMMSGFIFAFFGSFMFYLYSQKDVYKDWRRRIYLFPVFMAGSMGLSVNNTKAVIEGLLNKKSEFVRTPKYGVTGKQGSWADKKYTQKKINWVSITEFALALYCLAGIVMSIVYLEIAAVPFQMLYFTGFGTISYLSIREAVLAKKAAVRVVPNAQPVAEQIVK